MKLVNRIGQDRFVQGLNRMGQPGICAGTRCAIHVDVRPVHPEPDLDIRGRGVESVNESILGGIHFGFTRRVHVLHRPRGVQHQQHLGRDIIPARSRHQEATHGNQQQGPTGRRQAVVSVHWRTSHVFATANLSFAAANVKPPGAARQHPQEVTAGPPSSMDHEEHHKLHIDENVHISCSPVTDFSTPRNIFRHISHEPTKPLSREKDSDFRRRH